MDHGLAIGQIHRSGEAHLAAGAAKHQGAMRKLIEEAYQFTTHDRKQAHAKLVADSTMEFAKTAALFAPKGLGVGLSALVYAADEVKESGTAQSALCDMMLGAAKGLSLTYINRTAINEATHPLLQGATLGLGARLADITLTRSTWEDRPDGQINLWKGLQNVSAELTNMPALAADVAMFAGARTLMSHVDPALFYNKPHLAAAVSGGVFGTMGGAVAEIQREQQANVPLDWQSIARASTLAALRDASAAAMGSSLASYGRLEPHMFEAAPYPLDRAGERVREQVPPPRSPEAVQALQQHAQNVRALLEPVSTQFTLKDIDRWQSLINERINRREITPESAERIYTHIESLLRRKDATRDGVDSYLLARHLLAQVADPTLVSQGDHGSCYVAAAEHVMYTRDPEHAVKLVTDIAKTGSFTLPRSKETVSVDRASYIPHAENYDPFNEPALNRSYASHIFQQAVPNIYWQLEPELHRRGHQVRFEFKNMRLETGGDANSQPRTVRADKPTGVVFDHKTKQVLYNYPAIPAGHMAQLYEKIVPGAQLKEIYRMKDYTEFQQQLRRASQQRAFPALFGVNSRHELFKHPSGDPHCISILGVDWGANIVWVHNPWGRDYHKNGIALPELFSAKSGGRF